MLEKKPGEVEASKAAGSKQRSRLAREATQELDGCDLDLAQGGIAATIKLLTPPTPPSIPIPYPNTAIKE